MRCGRCKQAHYCTRDCQMIHWKAHKHVCIPCLGICTRCKEMVYSLSASCTVEHPAHLQEKKELVHTPHGTFCFFFCKACNARYKRAQKFPTDETPIFCCEIIGANKHCYQGKHTLGTMNPMDLRQHYKDACVLFSSQMDKNVLKNPQVTPNLRVLKIISSKYYFDDSIDIKFSKISLPNLEELHFVEVNLVKLILTNDNNPLLQKLILNTPTIESKPKYAIQCASLKHVSIYSWGPGEYTWVNDMLFHAVNLEIFDSYKLQVRYLDFQPKKICSIRLERSEKLKLLKIHSPFLQTLDLRGTSNLVEVIFEDQKDPRNTEVFSMHPLTVLINTSVFPISVKEQIMQNPRVVFFESG